MGFGRSVVFAVVWQSSDPLFINCCRGVVSEVKSILPGCGSGQVQVSPVGLVDPLCLPWFGNHLILCSSTVVVVSGVKSILSRYWSGPVQFSPVQWFFPEEMLQKEVIE